MPVFRKIPVWLVLASYLFASTFVAALHDHRDGCGHSVSGCHDGDRHRHFAREHSHGDESVTDDDGPGAVDGVHSPHVCPVCEFLAHAPLSAPVVALASAGDLLCDAVTLPVERLTNAVPGTHLARGPPAS